MHYAALREQSWAAVGCMYLMRAVRTIAIEKPGCFQSRTLNLMFYYLNTAVRSIKRLSMEKYTVHVEWGFSGRSPDSSFWHLSYCKFSLLNSGAMTPRITDEICITPICWWCYDNNVKLWQAHKAINYENNSCRVIQRMILKRHDPLHTLKCIRNSFWWILQDLFDRICKAATIFPTLKFRN